MNQKLLFFVAAFATVTGCNLLSGEKDLKAFIPGSYMYQGEQEYSKIRDSLVISETAGNDNVFRITRYSTINRIREGQILPAERRMQSMTALYDEKAKVLQESKTGRIISFDVEHDRIYVQTQAYQKVKGK